jgi:kumamolisin
VKSPGKDLTYLSETTWNESPGRPLAGGGGASIFWPIPDYQKAAAKLAPASSSVSQFSRNVPDISLNSDTRTGYLVAVTDPAAGPTFAIYGGTSAAAPLWAAFNALVNQGRAQAGKGPIGFINPALYALGPGGAQASRYAADFHDIKDGSNNIPYPAIPGYDLATGLGTFQGPSLAGDLIARP